jgi:spore coat polysaccharide biosynthesis protein SpsF
MKLQVRKALLKDAKFFYELRNESKTKKNSCYQGKIKYSDHLKWYKKKIKDKKANFFIAFANKSINVGIVRYETKKLLTYVSISIHRKFRNLGYGSKLLKMSEKFLKKKLIIISKIKKKNIPSIKIFHKNNYKLIDNDSSFLLMKIR